MFCTDSLLKKDMNATMYKYKLRAECQDDCSLFAGRLVGACRASNYKHRVETNIIPDPNYPDCDMDFSTTFPIDKVREIIAGIPDAHVMLETVEYEQNYTGDRSDISFSEPYASIMHTAKFLPNEVIKN